jgi:hypothetical protein
VWKKVWGPVEIQEWIPIPKPPLGWESKKLEWSLGKRKHKMLLFFFVCSWRDESTIAIYLVTSFKENLF